MMMPKLLTTYFAIFSSSGAVMSLNSSILLSLGETHYLRYTFRENQVSVLGVFKNVLNYRFLKVLDHKSLMLKFKVNNFNQLLKFLTCEIKILRKCIEFRL